MLMNKQTQHHSGVYWPQYVIVNHLAILKTEAGIYGLDKTMPETSALTPKSGTWLATFASLAVRFAGNACTETCDQDAISGSVALHFHMYATVTKTSFYNGICEGASCLEIY